MPPGVTLPTRKSEALLACLALPAGQARHRTELATLLWGSREERQARHSLNQALSSLRKALAPHGAELLMADEDMVALAPSLIETDVSRLETLLDDGSMAALSQAVDLYRNDLLMRMDVREDAFEDWLSGERRRLRDRALGGFRTLLEHRRRSGEPAAAVLTAKRILRLDPLDEPTHRHLMAVYAAQGQRNAALRQYRDCAELLRRELNVAPELETRSLYQRLVRGDAAAPVSPLADPTPPSPAPAVCTARPPTVIMRRLAAQSSDPVDVVVAESVSEDLLTVLSRDRGLTVLADTTLAPTGAYVIEGRLRRSDEQLCVTARLQDTSDGTYLWSERCTQPVDGRLTAESRLAQNLAAVFKREIEMAEARKAHPKAPETLDPWAYYHLGLRQMYRFTMPGLKAARDYLNRAVTMDPDHAAALARLAYVYVQMYWYGPHDTRDGYLDQGLAAATQAVGLDTRDAHGHFALGRLYAIRRQFDLAIPEFETAIGLDPSFAQASFGLGQAYSAAGRPREAIGLLDRAIDLNPADPHLWTFHHDRAEAKFALGRLGDAERDSKVAVRMPNASHFAWATLVAGLGAAGKREEAQEAIHQLKHLKREYALDFAYEELAHHANRPFVDIYLDGLARAGLPETEQPPDKPVISAPAY